MSNWWYSFYFLILGIVAFVTGEIVTFIMLGFVLLGLNNINITLKKILKVKNQDQSISEE